MLFVPPREKSNKYLADSGCDSAEQLWTKMENLRISNDSNKATTSQASSESINSSDFKGNTSDEDSDDDIEVISKLLESEVTLTNGKKIEVKKFIELLDKGNTRELEYNFKKLKSTDSASIAKEMALKLAHNLLHSKKDFDIVDSTAQNMVK